MEKTVCRPLKGRIAIELVLLCTLLHTLPTFGQSVLFDKKYIIKKNRADVYQMALEPGGKIYAAVSQYSPPEWGYQIHSGPNNGAGNGRCGFLKLTYAGDSLDLIKLDVLGRPNGLVRNPFGQYLVGVMQLQDTVYNSYIQVLMVDTLGNTLWRLPINEGLEGVELNKMISDEAGGCFLLGSATSVFPGGFRDWWLARVSYNGQLLWLQRFVHGNWNTAFHMEPMGDGNFLLSGYADNKIWSVVVDPDGVQVSEHTFYESPVNVIVDESSVRRAKNLTYIVNGGIPTNPSRFYLGRYDSSRQKLWGGLQSQSLQFMVASNDEGQVLLNTGLQNQPRFIRKLNLDSTLNWEMPFFPNVNNGRYIRDFDFDNEGNGILCGDALTSVLGEPDKMYFMKISNCGYAYNPYTDSITAAKDPMAKTKVVLYPNPSQDLVHIEGLQPGAKVEWISSEGRIVNTYTFKPKLGLPIWQLKEGLYFWRATDGKRVWSGKFVKN